MAKTAGKIKASTQEHLDIENITDDLVIFKTGWVGLVMTTTAVNFDLLSEAEQDATIYAYGAFLNSLTFPLQILIRSKKADITAYFQALEEAEGSQTNPDIKRQIQKYQDFLKTIVQQKTVLDKSFYLIINFSPLEMGFKGLGKKNPNQTKSKMQLLSDSKVALFPKRDHIVKQMGRLGLTVRQLNTKELIELFYDIYNPAPTGTQRVILDTSTYTVPIVQAAVEIPTPAPTPYGLGPTSYQPQAQVSQPVEADRSLRPAPPQTVSRDINPPPPNTKVPTEETLSSIPSQPQPSGTPPQPSAGASPSESQLDALKNLQAVTQKAATVIAQKQAPQSQTARGQTPIGGPQR